MKGYRHLHTSGRTGLITVTDYCRSRVVPWDQICWRGRSMLPRYTVFLLLKDFLKLCAVRLSAGCIQDTYARACALGLKAGQSIRLAKRARARR